MQLLIQYCPGIEATISDSKMQHIVHLAHGSSPNLWVVSSHGVDVIVCSMLESQPNVMGHDQVVIPSSGGLHVLLMQELHCTPLVAHLGVHKTAELLFACVQWPYLHDSVAKFACKYHVYLPANNSM